MPFVVTENGSEISDTSTAGVLETAMKFDKEAVTSGESVEVEGKGVAF